MGAWKELDTEIGVELDLSELDELINTNDEVFEPLKPIASDLKNAITNGSKRGVLEVAKKNISFQENFINANCTNPSGMLASSIDYTGGDTTYVTGTRINDIYPMSVEYGRRGFGPIHAKALAFYIGGELLFRKSVGPAKPRPFVAPAYEKTDSISEELIVLEIGHAGIEWD